MSVPRIFWSGGPRLLAGFGLPAFRGASMESLFDAIKSAFEALVVIAGAAALLTLCLST